MHIMLTTEIIAMIAAFDRCVVHEFAHFLGKRGSILFLEELKNNQPIGFNQFTRRLNLIPKTVSERLKELEENGLVQKNEEEKYILTPKGFDACKVIDSIKEFEMRWKLVPETCTETNCVDCKLGFVKPLREK